LSQISTPHPNHGKKNGALKLHLDAKIGITTTTTTRSVSHFGLAIYIKMYLKAKEELRKLKYLFHHAKIELIFKKHPLKETKILQEIL
jgi:hypothetical protein